MSTATKKQIENINKSLLWIKNNRPEEYDSQFLALVEERRKLRRLEDTEKDAPAIAAYGVSQVGKSYLMNCLLQKGGEPFMIEANGKLYNFIEDMNPIVRDAEATGVVTRFTSFNNDPERYSSEHPILMRCLTVSDIINVICDGYFNDIKDRFTDSASEIKIKGEEIYEKYKDAPENPSSPLQAEDVLNIKDYFRKHLDAQEFNKATFFDKVALVANKIPASDWSGVFSYLWSYNPYQTKLFNKLIGTLAKFKYSKYVYLPPEALLHGQMNENTIMSVQCLEQLFMENPLYFTDVYLREGEHFSKFTDIPKSEVCAVCAEIQIRIGEDYRNYTNRYCFDRIPSHVASRLSHENISMNILEDNDLLDFPGARSRIREVLDTMKDDGLLTKVLLRGKVAYLFNLYNDSQRINILLYCHDNVKNEVTDIYLLLRDWILNNVGETMRDRKNTLSLTGGISPLFYVGTKFNKDMSLDPIDSNNGINGINTRWQQRFQRVLYAECFNVDGNLDKEKEKIFLNWTEPGEHFTNSYILRDYRYSSPTGSNLYANEKSDQARMIITEEYYQNLRSTFCNHEGVKCFFQDPELSWDVCASINNDGALYIIDNLSKVAGKMNKTRSEQFKEALKRSCKKVYAIMANYYVSDNQEELLNENIRKANGIFRELEFTCQENPAYFGNLIQALQLTESACYNKIHSLIPHLADTVNSDNVIKDYELIRKRCNNFEGCKDEEEKWNCLVAVYRYMDKEEASSELKRRGINPQTLFSEAPLKRKNSAVISNELMTLWKSNITDLEFIGHFSGEQLMGGVEINNLIACLIQTAHNLKLGELIEQQIENYVDILAIAKINEELVADIIATTISDYIINFGYNYLTEEQIATAKNISKEQGLSCFEWIERTRQESYTEEEMARLFNDILSSADKYTPAYDANYNAWLEYMYIAFIAHLNFRCPNIQANNELKAILDELKY